MDKFSELKAAAMAATPGPWRAISFDDRLGISGDGNAILVCEHITKQRPQDALFIAAANPAAVLELLAERDADKKRIAGLERILDGVTPVMIAGGWTAKGISDYAKSLEAKLATPVRLPVVLMGYQSDDYRIGFMEGVEKSGDEVRAAGFTVEGDE